MTISTFKTCEKHLGSIVGCVVVYTRAGSCPCCDTEGELLDELEELRFSEQEYKKRIAEYKKQISEYRASLEDIKNELKRLNNVTEGSNKSND